MLALSSSNHIKINLCGDPARMVARRLLPPAELPAVLRVYIKVQLMSRIPSWQLFFYFNLFPSLPIC